MRAFILPSGTILDLDKLSLTDEPHLGPRAHDFRRKVWYHDVVCSIQIDGSPWKITLLHGLEFFEPGRGNLEDVVYIAEQQSMLERGKEVHRRLVKAWLQEPEVGQREERLINV